MKKLSIIGGILILLFGVPAVSSAITSYYIVDNATGGDCTMIGTWDNATKTCTLANDLNDSNIEIQSNGIILDGNGYTVNVGSPLLQSYGVVAYNRTGVMIKDLTVRNISIGIYLSNCSYCTLTGNTIKNTQYGIYLIGGDNNTLTDNTSMDNTSTVGGQGFGIWLLSTNNNTLTCNTSSQNSAGIVLYYGEYNTITGNTANNNSYGVYLAGASNNTLTGNSAKNNSAGILNIGSSYNTFTGNNVNNNINGIELFSGSTNNTFSGNAANNNSFGFYIYSGSNSNDITGSTLINNGYGIYSEVSSNNQIYKNKFINNGVQAEVNSGGNNFNLAAPTGGNYWSDYNSPSEGCDDVDHDGFCDAPYIFTGGQDNLPWKTPSMTSP